LTVYTHLGIALAAGTSRSDSQQNDSNKMPLRAALLIRAHQQKSAIKKGLCRIFWLIANCQLLFAFLSAPISGNQRLKKGCAFLANC
jgi:hypothetical protein